jgi:hypothetical protein
MWIKSIQACGCECERPEKGDAILFFRRENANDGVSEKNRPTEKAKKPTKVAEIVTRSDAREFFVRNVWRFFVKAREFFSSESKIFLAILNLVKKTRARFSCCEQKLVGNRKIHNFEILAINFLNFDPPFESIPNWSNGVSKFDQKKSKKCQNRQGKHLCVFPYLLRFFLQPFIGRFEPGSKSAVLGLPNERNFLINLNLLKIQDFEKVINFCKKLTFSEK